ncbi:MULTISPECIES: hypothetical protein [unclassified Neisseria]|uniref:hypothetical protein n=1 Tax=unclassified Neisseria TaxID=2623750 RepID=UPI001072DF7E|nr:MULTISPECIES: hypothetical protein [unclassified Neisseria]MBF0803549.1 hypothetical protein [Neisseria sp. 19428wB4_WF04]TFU43729.1 hypothetical protein E4T99_04135 [Neisseria sp. WF04]
MNTRHLIIPLLAASCSAWADNAAEYRYTGTGPTSAAAPDNDTWADRRHKAVKNRLKSWAHNIDDWFGEPDPDNPADANLRVMIDTKWNKYDHFSVKPRIRGRVKLPVLQQRINVVFGDDSLDNEPRNNIQIYEENTSPENKTFDKTHSRESNSSLALRWSGIGKRSGIDTDADIGIRSGNDLYLRLKGSKDWQLGGDFSTRFEPIYRYGIDSKHYVRTNWEVRRFPEGNTFTANQFHLQYTRNNDEEWTWGNSLYRQHNLPGHKRLNYGIYTSGNIKARKAKLNSYGPFAGWRQPIWREWLFVQTEINYLNNREENRPHHIGTLLRAEALF